MKVCMNFPSDILFLKFLLERKDINVYKRFKGKSLITLIKNIILRNGELEYLRLIKDARTNLNSYLVEYLKRNGELEYLRLIKDARTNLNSYLVEYLKRKELSKNEMKEVLRKYNERFNEKYEFKTNCVSKNNMIKKLVELLEDKVF